MKFMRRVVLAVFLLFVTVMTAQAVELVVNGGFETGSFTGWTLVGDKEFNKVNGSFPHWGTYVACLGEAPGLGRLSQTLATTPGKEYTVSFWILANMEAANTFSVKWNDNVLYSDVDILHGNYVRHHYTVMAAGNDTLEFSFSDGADYIYLDDVSVSDDPLPIVPGTDRWTYSTGNTVSTAALASDGTIYVGSGDYNLYAINPDGTLKWSYTAGDAVYSPAVGTDGTIYAGSGDHNLYAINPNGTLKWSYTVGDISGSLAIAADGTVYVGSWDHKLYAINPNGTLKWSYTAGDTVYSPAVGTDGTIYAGSYDHNLYAINPNGTLKWSYATGDTIGSLAIATDGTIYAGSDDRNLYAINPNGTLKWSYEASDVIYSPAIGSDGTIYAGSNNSLLYAINPNGTPKWGYYLGFYTVSGTPAVGADGVIYVGAGGCGLLAINPNGTPKWVFENNLYNRYASPAIGSDGVVYAGGDKLYAISSTSTGLANSSWPMAHHDAQRTGRLPGSSSSVWLTVSKPGTGSGAVTSTPSGINCGTVCSYQYTKGAMVTLTAAADSGSTFTGWSTGGCSGTGTCVVTLNAATTVTATFTQNTVPQYTLTVGKSGTGGGTVTSSPTGITCGSTCSAQYAQNTTVTLTAAADSGSTFTGWSTGGCSGTGTCVVTLNAATTVTATFTQDVGIQYTLTVSKSGTGTGTVTSSPAGIDCGSTCSAGFDAMTPVTLTAQAGANAVFAGWSGACTGTGTCVVTMDAVKSVTAVFEVTFLGTPKISVSPSSVNFGTIKTGTSVYRVLTVKNTGTGILIPGDITLSGANAGEFSLTTDCEPLTKNETCSVTVSLVSGSYGTKSAVLTIPSNSTKKPVYTVNLKGKCAPPKVAVSPGAANFGTVAVGAVSKVKNITIKNTGTSDLIIGSITQSGDTSFAVTANPCGTIVKGGSCAVSLTFMPSAAGSLTGSLAIASNDPLKGTVTVKLSGKGK